MSQLDGQILVTLCFLSVLILHVIGSPPHRPDKAEKPVGMNIKLRLAEERELEEGAARGPTLEFVLEKEEVLLKEEQEEELRGQSQQQLCTKVAENDETDLCSAGSPQTLNSDGRPDTSP